MMVFTEQLEKAIREIINHLEYAGTLSDEEQAMSNLRDRIADEIRQVRKDEREACALIVADFPPVIVLTGDGYTAVNYKATRDGIVKEIQTRSNKPL